MDTYHEDCLEKEGCAVVCAKPVEQSVAFELAVPEPISRKAVILQYRCDQHDQRNIKGKARARLVLVDRVYLVGIAGYWRRHQTRNGVSAYLAEGGSSKAHTRRVRKGRR